jgi:hypothetical protein
LLDWIWAAHRDSATRKQVSKVVELALRIVDYSLVNRLAAESASGTAWRELRRK